MVAWSVDGNRREDGAVSFNLRPSEGVGKRGVSCGSILAHFSPMFSEKATEAPGIVVEKLESLCTAERIRAENVG